MRLYITYISPYMTLIGNARPRRRGFTAALVESPKHRSPDRPSLRSAALATRRQLQAPDMRRSKCASGYALDRRGCRDAARSSLGSPDDPLATARNAGPPLQARPCVG